MQKQLDLSIAKAKAREERELAENSNSKILPRFHIDAENSKAEAENLKPQQTLSRKPTFVQKAKPIQRYETLSIL